MPEEFTLNYTSRIRSKKDDVKLSQEINLDDFMLLSEVQDPMRVNNFEFSVLKFEFDRNTITTSEQENTINGTYKLSLQLGIFDEKILDLAIKVNCLSKVVSESFVVKCTRENDLVDFFKTMHQG